MPDSLKQLLGKEAMINGFANTFFNALAAWLLLRGGSALGWSGDANFTVDIVATAFILPFIVTLIVVPLQRRKVRQGKRAAIELDARHWLQGLVLKAPASLFLSAILFGVVGMLIFIPLGLLALLAAGVEQLAPLHYSLFKGLWAGLMAAALVVPMVLHGLRLSN